MHQAETLDIKRVMSIERAEKHVAEGLVRVEKDTETFCRCVDGRYPEGEELPPVARPGGTIGLYMALTAAARKLNLPLNESNRSALWKMVEKTVCADKAPERACFHTDDRNADPGAGCGHIMKALEFSEDYGLKREDMEYIVGMLPALLGQGARQDILPGRHGEEAIIIVTSDTYSLKPQVRVDGKEQQAFVYQKTLDGRLLKKLGLQLARHIQEHGVTSGDTIEDFMLRVQKEVMDASDLQLNTTVEKLTKDFPLPVYVADVGNDGKVSVKEVS